MKAALNKQMSIAVAVPQCQPDTVRQNKEAMGFFEERLKIFLEDHFQMRKKCVFVWRNGCVA